MAQGLLETGEMSIDRIASASGFGTANNLRDHFQRANGVSPQLYRRTFSSRFAGLRQLHDSSDAGKHP
jgi:AraC family transcriptional regulator, transcriptional activator FtrA